MSFERSILKKMTEHKPQLGFEALKVVFEKNKLKNNGGLLFAISRMLLTKDLVLEGAFFPNQTFSNLSFLFQDKKSLPKIYIMISLRIFKNLTNPLIAL